MFEVMLSDELRFDREFFPELLNSLSKTSDFVLLLSDALYGTTSHELCIKFGLPVFLSGSES